MNRTVNWLFEKRKNNDGLVNTIAKGIINGLIGQMNAEWEDDKTSTVYNPMAAAEIYANCRLQVMKFIIENNLQDHVISIATDGVLTDVPVSHKAISKEKILGTWRLSNVCPAIVLSPGYQLYKDKHPQGITYDRLVELINDKPNSSRWVASINRPCTLYQALAEGDIKRVGKIVPRQTTIDLLNLEIDQNRLFKKFPKTGKQLLSGTIYNSEPIKI